MSLTDYEKLNIARDVRRGAETDLYRFELMQAPGTDAVVEERRKTIERADAEIARLEALGVEDEVLHTPSIGDPLPDHVKLANAQAAAQADEAPADD